ncbi:MAG: hypothetical protein KDA65_06580 [Planctomycetaceae bacterium]|nr:hypothetical protein [Planctomycetaceae bacterium]
MTKTITIYEGFFGDETYTFALTEEKCHQLIQESFLYGEPNEADPGSRGTDWGENAWHIHKRVCKVQETTGELKGDYRGETAHVCWCCPLCDRWYSDDYYGDLESPYLASCSCGVRDQSNYILISFS